MNGSEEMSIGVRVVNGVGLVAGIILAVLGALTLSESILTLMGNPAFIFVENINRGFELVVGFVTIMVAVSTMDMSSA